LRTLFTKVLREEIREREDAEKASKELEHREQSANPDSKKQLDLQNVET